MAKDPLHVVLVPWLAFGHLTPSLRLSIDLAKAGVHTWLVSTTRNIQRLPILPPDVAAGMVHLVALPRPPMDSTLLPEDAEATVDISFDKIQYLKIAYDLLKVPFEKFISNMSPSPSWIISDIIAPSWLVEVAQMHKIPIITFYPSSSSTAVFMGPPEVLRGEGPPPSLESLTMKPPWVDFPSTVAFKKYEAVIMHSGLPIKDASGLSTGDRIGAVVSGSKALVIRSCPEIESDYFNLFGKITGKHVIPLGFLPPEKSTKSTADISDKWWKETFKWLDEQKARSVVFVGFGSECKLSKDQIHKIAGGLELSGLPFLWALQKPAWADNEHGGDAVLPPGFTTRIAGRGVVQIGWAPQKEILSHPSIGGSLFHAGWGSAIETLQHGHCLVLLPFVIDQGLNARFLVEKGLGIEVERNEEDGSFLEEDIAKALSHAMVLSVEEETLRAKAASIFGNPELNDGYIERFVEYLKNQKVKVV